MTIRFCAECMKKIKWAKPNQIFAWMILTTMSIRRKCDVCGKRRKTVIMDNVELKPKILNKKRQSKNHKK